MSGLPLDGGSILYQLLTSPDKINMEKLTEVSFQVGRLHHYNRVHVQVGGTKCIFLYSQRVSKCLREAQSKLEATCDTSVRTTDNDDVIHPPSVLEMSVTIDLMVAACKYEAHAFVNFVLTA